MGHAALCIGVDMAVNTIVEACDRILAQRLAVGALFALEAGAYDELLAL